MSNVYENAKSISEKVKELISLKENSGSKERIRELVVNIKKDIANIYSEVGSGGMKSVPQIPTPHTNNIDTPQITKHILSPEFASQKFKNLSDATKKQYIKDLNISYYQLDSFVKEQRKKKTEGLKKVEYSVYGPSEVGKFANRFAKHYADVLIRTHPTFFTFLFKSFKRVNMPMLSRTYVSMMIFFSIISLPIAFVVFVVLNLSFNLTWIFVVLMAVLAPFITFIGFYLYPASLAGEIKKKIREELPFALVYMSAIAGSGANPTSVFELLAESDEYPALNKEIKKILNYVNLFGYDLTTALKHVSKSTPSDELKDLLNGIISTIETGGDLRQYLKSKADEQLNSYRLRRKKKTEALSTYSEIYTAVLIAAPLLLMVTLAIINSIGGEIGGISASIFGWVAILGVLPILNIAFMVFLSKITK